MSHARGALCLVLPAPYNPGPWWGWGCTLLDLIHMTVGLGGGVQLLRGMGGPYICPDQWRSWGTEC